MPWMQLLKIFMEYKTEETQGKKWYRSKTLLSMGLTTLILILNNHFGLEIPSEVQVAVLFIVGAIMRFVSKGAIGFYEDADPGTAKEAPAEDSDGLTTYVSEAEPTAKADPPAEAENSPPEPSKTKKGPTPPEKEKTPEIVKRTVAAKPFKPFNVSHTDGEH